MPSVEAVKNSELVLLDTHFVYRTDNPELWKFGEIRYSTSSPELRSIGEDDTVHIFHNCGILRNTKQYIQSRTVEYWGERYYTYSPEMWNIREQ